MNAGTRIVALVIVSLVVTSTLAPLMFAQNVSAAETEQCISKVTGKPMQCGVDYSSPSGQTVEEVWLSMHVSSEAMHDRYERYTVEKASISNLTTGMMTEEGIVAFIQAYNSGKSPSEAKLAGVNEVNDFASGIQASVAYEQTAQAEQARVMYKEANGTSGMTVGDVFPRAGGNWRMAWGNRTLTLYNGTEINVTSFGAVDTYYHNNEPTDDYVYTYYDVVADSTIQTEDGSEKVGDDYYDSADGAHLSGLNVRGPSSVNGQTVHAMDAERVKWTMDIVDSNRKVAIDNVKAFAESYVQQYEPGEVKAEEFMSPSYRLRHHATDYSSTGHYAYLLFTAQDRGMAVDLDTGFTVRYNQSGPMPAKTIDGGLYATSGTFPNDVIETDIQYDATTLNGTVWVINANNSQQTMLNGTFTVLEMRDIDNGTTVNQTSLQEATFATRSADGFKQDVQDWQKEWDRQQQIERDYNISTSFAITWPWEGDSDWLGLPDISGQTVGILLLGLVGLLIGVGFVINAVKPY